jgi:PleD family two-component response regulator
MRNALTGMYNRRFLDEMLEREFTVIMPGDDEIIAARRVKQ